MGDLKKLIDIKEKDVEPLKIMAVKENKDLKNYIQDVLSNHVISHKIDKEKSKKIKDLVNWVKSDLKQETNNKIGRTATPYRADKIRFLNKMLDLYNL